METSRLSALARDHQLIFLGVSTLELSQDYSAYRTWIAEKRHGDMHYLERQQTERASAEAVFPGTRSILSVAISYAGDKPHLSSPPRVAAYATRRDYHRILRERSESFCRSLRSTGGMSDRKFRVTVDTAPVLERAIAAHTRRGFVGKNTLYIHPEYGSYLLLGEIYTDCELSPDLPAKIDLARKTAEGGCGPCSLCQKACPTGALDEDYRIDATRCLSYWTIEHRGTIPVAYWPHLKDYWFGCDICQNVCPYNIKVKDTAEWSGIPERDLPGLSEVAQMNQSQYEKWFGGTPLTRAKRSGLRRNALIALCMMGHPDTEKAIASVDADPQPPLVETVEQWRNLQRLGA